MNSVCSSKREAAITLSPPTEFVMRDHSKTPRYPHQGSADQRRVPGVTGSNQKRGLCRLQTMAINWLSGSEIAK